MNEIAKDALCDYRGYSSSREMTALERVSCGACAGFSYWVGTCPLDCVKSQMMMTRQSDRPRMFWLSTARAMYAEGGVARFYR